MKNINLPFIKSIFLILTFLAVSCVEEVETSIKKEKISGFVQKGPFVSGTTVTMNELNSELVQTGKVFTSTIINDSGLFEVNNIELISSFVELTSSGFYFNEVSGMISSSQITLTTLSNIEDRNSINVNILTHLEKRRVEKLIKEGKSFSESKTQSRNELLSVFSLSLNNNSSFEEFDISKNTEEGGILLGISIILQGNRSVGQLTELLSQIQNDFSNNGKLDEKNLLNSIRTSTLDLDLQIIRKNIEKRFKELNINSSVPDFETQIRKILSLKNLNITIEGEGTVEEKIVTNSNGREYPVQTVVELTPIPKDGWEFESWDGDLTGTETPQTITVDKEKNVTVKFKRKDYKINITIEGEGTLEERIVTNPNGRMYPFQTVVELTPVPKEGWVFESWGGDLEGTETPQTITVDKERNVTVKFREPIFRLSENGVTCICENVKSGEKGFINGIEYEAVDNNLIRKRRDEGADMTKLCTSLVTDMGVLFNEKSFNQPIGNWDVSNVTDMRLMFRSSNFNQPIGDWDVSKVSTMLEMFQFGNFNQPIGNWNVGNVLNMAYMFEKTPFNQPIGNWNVSKIRSMKSMFKETTFNNPLGNWDVSNVTDMGEMFRESNFNQPLNNWNVSNVTDMGGMFFGTPFNQPLDKWNVGRVTKMWWMFKRTPFNNPIGNWDVKNVRDMGGMFWESKFNQSIGNWNVGNVELMAFMFKNSPFNQPIGNWNVEKVSNMEEMFRESDFNQFIGNWNVGNVTTMKYMFRGSNFNQPIGDWDVGNVRNMSGLFSDTPFNQPIENWNVENVSSMYWMFSRTPFNQNIGNWDVSKVRDMGEMFSETPFNHDIGNWDVSSVSNMFGMFLNAKEFNQDLSNWCVSLIPVKPENFDSNASSWLLPKPVWGTCPN